MIIKPPELDSIVHGYSHDPHHLLGMHLFGEGKGVVVRCWDPTASRVIVKDEPSGEKYPMHKFTRTASSS